MSNKKRKQQMRLIREKYELEKDMKEHPDWCFCKRKYGLGVDIDEDKPIGETEPVDGFPYWDSIGYTELIYECKRCGKKCTIGFAY